MEFPEIVAIAMIVLIIGGAVAYIVKAKKNGAKCIGCPHAKSCASREKSKVDARGETCGGSCGSCGCSCSKPSESTDESAGESASEAERDEK